MKTVDLVLTALFSALLCILSVVSVPIGTVPVTLSLFGIFLIGAVLKTKLAVSAVLVYIIIGALGLPVFSQFSSGLGVLFGPTGGYIWSYPIMTAIISYTQTKIKKHGNLTLIISMSSSLLICYFIGTSWYCLISDVPFYSAFMVCCVPFIFFDIIKLIAAFLISNTIKKSAINKLFI